jgi:hypothetical protein
MVLAIDIKEETVTLFFKVMNKRKCLSAPVASAASILN